MTISELTCVLLSTSHYLAPALHCITSPGKGGPGNLFGLQYPLFLVAESKFPPRGSILGYYMLLWGKLLQKIATRQAYNASRRDAL